MRTPDDCASHKRPRLNGSVPPSITTIDHRHKFAGRTSRTLTTLPSQLEVDQDVVRPRPSIRKSSRYEGIEGAAVELLSNYRLDAPVLEDSSAQTAASYTARSIRDAIGNWLRNAPIQARAGEGSGGIAGVLHRDGNAPYVYGEITGYWLRWASLYAPDPARMRDAVDFLRRQWSRTQPGATRVGVPDDWRNRAIFTFDLGMAVRGLADAVPVVGEAACAEAAAGIMAWIERMIGPDGRVEPVLPLATDPLPDTWSTRPGPFQAKPAAAILQTPEGWLSRGLREAANATLAYWNGLAFQHAHVHPRMYTLEGMYAAGRLAEPETVLATVPEDGIIPEKVGRGDLRRSDAQAQVLRLLCLDPHAPAQVRDRVGEILCGMIHEDGRVPFRPGETGANVWCAMFVHQALDWWCHLNGDCSSLPPSPGHIV